VRIGAVFGAFAAPYVFSPYVGRTQAQTYTCQTLLSSYAPIRHTNSFVAELQIFARYKLPRRRRQPAATRKLDNVDDAAHDVDEMRGDDGDDGAPRVASKRPNKRARREKWRKRSLPAMVAR
jgi:hypothetical protein